MQQIDSNGQTIFRNKRLFVLFSGAQAAAEKGPVFTGEYLEYNSGWMVAMITEDSSSEVKLTDLSEGNRYQVDPFFSLPFYQIFHC